MENCRRHQKSVAKTHLRGLRRARKDNPQEEKELDNRGTHNHQQRRLREARDFQRPQQEVEWERHQLGKHPHKGVRHHGNKWLWPLKMKSGDMLHNL